MNKTHDDEMREEQSIRPRPGLDLKGVGCEEYEKEINERVARLYGLSISDVAPTATGVS